MPSSSVPCSGVTSEGDWFWWRLLHADPNLIGYHSSLLWPTEKHHSLQLGWFKVSNLALQPSPACQPPFARLSLRFLSNALRVDDGKLVSSKLLICTKEAFVNTDRPPRKGSKGMHR